MGKHAAFKQQRTRAIPLLAWRLTFVVCTLAVLAMGCRPIGAGRAQAARCFLNLTLCITISTGFSISRLIE